MRLVLASASPRRAELLRAAGFEFETLVVDVDERVHPGEAADAYVRRLAKEKAARAMEGMPGDDYIVVLGADTAVVVDGAILGKPVDDRDAASMLRRLSGRSHQVLTGISLRISKSGSVRPGAAPSGPGSGSDVERSRVEATTVEFSPLTEDDVAWYVASGEGRDKAGAYAIQGLASRFIPRVNGSYSNVVGLPVAAVHELLAEIASRP
jgi:septum formation protein